MCPFCAVATRVAVPGCYSLAPFDRLKQIDLRLWAESGPWAPRRLAAIDYVPRINGSTPRPTGWDWAAQTLKFAAPRPLVRGTFLGAPRPIPAVAKVKVNSTRTREPEPETSDTAPIRPLLARDPETRGQMMEPGQPVAPKR